MAEAVLAPVEESAPNPEAVTQATEVAQEAAPEANQEETNEIDSLLSTFADGEETSATDGPATPEDGAPADPYAGLTPTQIAEKVRQEEAEKSHQQNNSAQRQAYLQGLTRVVKDSPQKLTDLAERLGIVGDDRKAMTDAFAQLNGAYTQLYQHDVQQMSEVAAENLSKAYYEGTVKALGKEAAEAVYKDNPGWEVFFDRVGEEYAKKKGLLSPKEAKENYYSKATVKKRMEAYDQAMKDRFGVGLAALDGTANTQLPPIRGGSGGSQPKNYAEAEAWHASGKWDNAQWRAYKATHSRD